MSSAVEQLQRALEDVHFAISRFIQEQEEAAQPPKPNNRKKLTNREVADIRENHRLGFTQRDLADIYDVNPATISRIVRKVYHR